MANNRIVSIGIAAVFGAALLGGGCSAPEPDGLADTAFVNAKAYTLDDTQPWVDTVLVQGSSIIYAGTRDGAEALIGESTAVTDLNGQLMLPGFIDTHVHPIAGGAYATALALDTFGDVDGWVAAIEDYAKATGSTGPMRRRFSSATTDCTRTICCRDW